MEASKVPEDQMPTNTEDMVRFNMKDNNQTMETQYGTLLKKVVKKGTGIVRPILDDSKCTVRISTKICLQISEEIQSLENQIVIIGQAENDYIEFIEDCLKTMVEGEISYFTCYRNWKNSLNKEVRKKTKELTRREITLHLISIEKPKMLFNEFTAEETLKRGQHLKEKGNKLFKEGNCRLAFKNYSKALKMILFFEFVDLPKEIEDDWDKTKCQCYLNLAACQMKSEQWQFVIENCSNGLKIQPNNVKGLYRRSQANVKLQDLDSAKADLLQCIKLEPNSKSACLLLVEIEEKLKGVTLEKTSR